jgi:hypothetical protein
MSTLEMPAGLALLLVMANLALCLSAENRLLIPNTAPQAVMALDSALAITLCGDAGARTANPAPTGAGNC